MCLFVYARCISLYMGLLGLESRCRWDGAKGFVMLYACTSSRVLCRGGRHTSKGPDLRTPLTQQVCCGESEVPSLVKYIRLSSWADPDIDVPQVL